MGTRPTTKDRPSATEQVDLTAGVGLGKVSQDKVGTNHAGTFTERAETYDRLLLLVLVLTIISPPLTTTSVRGGADLEANSGSISTSSTAGSRKAARSSAALAFVSAKLAPVASNPSSQVMWRSSYHRHTDRQYGAFGQAAPARQARPPRRRHELLPRSAQARDYLACPSQPSFCPGLVLAS
jgi:hypothetical protein